MRSTDQTSAPSLPGWVRRPTESVFAALAGLRQARVFHPHGVTLRARLEVPADGGLTDTELFRPGRHADALVRFSHGVGTPVGWPDILGLAVKVPDAYGHGRDQDLLLVTSGDAPVTRHLLVPALAYTDEPYSSLLLFDVGPTRLFGGRVTVTDERTGPVRSEDLVTAAGDQALRIELTTATPTGPWRRLAVLEPFDVLAEHTGEALRFSPWNTGGGIRPVGALNRLRAPAYLGSQRGRARR